MGGREGGIEGFGDLWPRKGTTWSRSNAGRPCGTRHVFASCPSAESAGLSWIRPFRADSREGASHSMNSPFETAKTLLAKSETFCLGKRAGSRGHVPGIRTLKRMAFRIFPLSGNTRLVAFFIVPPRGAPSFTNHYCSFANLYLPTRYRSGLLASPNGRMRVPSLAKPHPSRVWGYLRVLTGGTGMANYYRWRRTASTKVAFLTLAGTTTKPIFVALPVLLIALACTAQEKTQIRTPTDSQDNDSRNSSSTAPTERKTTRMN